jgi:5-oxopent-3-ene-1,2,5-tricarboxylate decarboxylase/2-hydroxyhepta-2,4-diene-1,7-dioate isomerase
VSESLAMRTVYGTLLNSRAEWDQWSAKMNDAPYKAPPKAPVLYVKPVNTWSRDGASITIPVGVDEVEVGATVAAVMKAPGEVAGYVLMNDFSITHDSYFRPPVKFKCLDGFLGVGSTVLHAEAAVDPAWLVVEVRINGELKQTVKFDQLVRPPEKLLADVDEFMTLGAGDCLMLGLAANRPRARAGDTIELRGEGLGTLTQHLVAEAP